MNTKELCELGLKLPEPWHVSEVSIEKRDEGLVLHVHIDHTKGSRFHYESELCPVYDHQVRTWKHLNFWEHKCEIHARVPRVKLRSGKIKLVSVPWASSESSFTLKYEQNIIDLVAEGLSASGVGRHLGIGAKRVFGVIRKRVSQALSTQDIKIVKELSVDETSFKKGHNYFTILADREEKKVVGVSVGKDKDAFAHALVDMEVRGGDRSKVRAVTMDMSTSYISAVTEHMEQAKIVFDRFHIIKKMNEAVDQIRKVDRKSYAELVSTRYLWLKNNVNLTDAQKTKVEHLAEAYPNIGEAYRLKELLKITMDNAYKERKVTPLNIWMKEAWKSELEPIRKFVNMLKTHWYGVKQYFYRLSTNAYAERINLTIQEIKRTAKGYRNIHNFIIMIYFHLGRLNLKPTQFG